MFFKKGWNILILSFLFFLHHFSGYSLAIDELTIEEAVKLSLERNTEIRQKFVNKDISKYETLSKKGERWGTLSGFLNYTHYNFPRALAPEVPVKATAENIFIPGLKYTLPLFTGFKIEKEIEISKLKENLSDVLLNLTKNEIAFNVRSIYLKILTLQRQKEAMENYNHALTQLYKDIETQVKVGKKPEVDLLKVSYVKRDVESQIIALQNTIETLKETLKILINYPKENFVLKDISVREISGIELSRENFLKTYYPKLYSSKKAEILKEISRKKIEQAKAPYFPQLILDLDYQKNLGNGKDKEVWQIGFMLNFTLFDFGKRSSDLVASKLSFENSLLEEEKTRLEFEKRLTEAINQIKTAQAEVDAIFNQIKYADEVERIEKIKYEEGVSSLYDYLYAQSQKFISQSKYYEALYNRERSWYYLDYVLEKID
ncbi:hypothetical protein THC_0101 [Caldimicrobium thiodismutans]|uniref:TolC family protein n=1 Tax=Caldimicrobium thiodismutans TaxID=1653476 RepID=A0A0U4W016_9BACT|nr:TolC family protein [Caldimicrobium thiodismutans]BAU22507.1 hypothetical protein THC_0101 [Caldimicrobium thiodismutans]